MQATGLWNNEDEDMVPEKAELLGMTAINDLYCLVDGVRLAHNARRLTCRLGVHGAPATVGASVIRAEASPHAVAR